jgi:predicted DNA-binding transcriptional regulator YafY
MVVSKNARVDRVLDALRLLQRSGGVTIRELQDELRVTTRTIQRDLVLLSARFPVVRDDDAWPPRWRVTSNAMNAPPGLTASEIVALGLARSHLSERGIDKCADALTSVIQKALELAPFTTRARVGALSRDRDAKKPSAGASSLVLDVIVDAMHAQRCVSLDYAARSPRGRRWRAVEPLVLAHRRSGIYLVARDRHGLEPKHFALARIRGVRPTHERFTQQPFDVEAHFASRFGVHGGDLQDVSIRFDAESASYVRERTWHPSQEIVEERGGSIVLKMRVAGLLELKSWVQSFGVAATVLSPLELVETVRREARLVAGRSGHFERGGSQAML